ncbi:hypothetical protein OS493_005803 [Desmophyllum pertusum]|uniref:Uncharacterized protein n=1 Tax=Desmophyllum pertusum TaxID=174260 RepID=A0A9W9YIG5_9CNID|nr:hypothetical protein OS493_005803 [Desmophyllum pertusum]
MSDDQENVDEITGALLRSQTAKELEIQLRQLRRKGALLQRKKKAERPTGRTLSRMELELPTVQPSSLVHGPAKGDSCVSKTKAKGPGQEEKQRKGNASQRVTLWNLDARTKTRQRMDPRRTSVKRVINVDSSEKVTPVRKEQRLKQLLRGQLISCYDLGPVIEPFDVIVGESLSRKNPQSVSDELEIPKPDFPRGKQDIFPFAVPYLRLPLLPSSRNELVRISQALTKCELFPWQLQNIKMKYKRRRDLKTLVSTRETSPADNEEHKSTTQERDKAALQIFVPASS